jgi:16S rRNA (cytosine967-C5)-methyltransferase
MTGQRSRRSGKPERSGRSPGHADGSQARRAAYDVLHEVGSQGAYANIVLGQVLKDYDLDSRDAAFVTDVVNGTLRYRLTLDAVIEACTDRPLAKLDPRVLDVLRLGSYQLLVADTDAYAAVDTSVNLARSVSGPGPVGLVNAVLRRVSSKSFSEWTAEITEGKDVLAARSLATSHPTWIVSALTDGLGRARAAEIDDLLAANNEAARATLVVRPGLAEVDELVAAGASPARFSPYGAVAPPGSISNIAAVRQRRAGVQDEGSQLVAAALANAEVAGTESTWLDMCAGPGGKFALLSALGAQRGVVTAGLELHEHRARLVRQSLRGVPGYAGVAVGDGTNPPIRPGVDRILLDVPCTGLGVLRRRPDLRWRRSPSDIPELSKLQRELLNAALDLVRPGGVVAYATCSPHLAETDLVVSAVLKRRDDAVVEDSRGLFVGVPELGDGPNVRLWPHIHGTDGMFFALLRKRT